MENEAAGSEFPPVPTPSVGYDDGSQGEPPPGFPVCCRPPCLSCPGPMTG